MTMPMRSTAAFLVLISSFALEVHAVTSRLPRSTPEAEGVPSAAILGFVDAADTQIDALHSMMLVRHGKVIAEGWWAPATADDRHMLYSLSKSFTSTAVGIAVAEGRLSVDDPVTKFFPDQVPAEPGAQLPEMRVRDLLTMSTGHHADAIADFNLNASEPATRRFLALPVAHKPGTHFVYNSPATFMQSAIVQKVTGQNLVEFLRPRLFEPLGITDPVWEMTDEGIAVGASGLSIRTEDIACFGQLFLQRGQWNGKQLVPAAWVDAATSRQVGNGSNPASDWDQGYGFQFWRCRPGFARADGAFGQFCFIMPQHDAVLVLTSGVKDMQAVMNLVWDRILPAFGSAALAADPAQHEALRERLAGISVHAPAAQASSPQAARFLGRTYTFPANDQGIESITLQAGPDGESALVVRGERSDGGAIAVGHGAWKRGYTTFGTDVGGRTGAAGRWAVAGNGGWSAPDTFVAKLAYFETPYALTLTLQFGGDIVVLGGEYNVSFRPSPIGPIVGRAAPVASP